MDAAKIMWVMYEHPEADFMDMAMRFVDIRKRIYTFPKMGEKAYFICVPTSSGTGSEVNPFAVITDEENARSKKEEISRNTVEIAEAQLKQVKPYVDAVLTYEELQALFDSRDMDITALEEDVLDNASYFGRIFARSGGLADAVAEALKEQGIEDFDLSACSCDGIEQCRTALMKKKRGVLPENFIEGMACTGGCIGGAGCLTHGEKNKAQVDAYGREALEKTITDAISVLKK